MPSLSRRAGTNQEGTAIGIAADLLTVPVAARRAWFESQPESDQDLIFNAFDREFGTPWAYWRDDPVGFIRDALGEFIWSRQIMIAESVVTNRRTAVPACHAPGKTHLAARLVAWWVAVHEPGSAIAVTTATAWKQVQKQLWPHILRVADRHELPGKRNQTDWYINKQPVAYGFAQNKYDEAAAQGIHSEHLLIIVDEAGGIVPLLGENLNALTTGEGTRLLAIGNPPTDEEGAWFETICESSLWNQIPIPAFVTPNFTAEKESVPEIVRRNLIDPRWVEEQREQYGEDSAFWTARILAQFPKTFASKVVPLGWVEDAMDNERPVHSDWQRLGVDVAADGGDEMCVAWADGNDITIAETWANADAANQVDNAYRVLDWIKRAEGRQKQKGYISRPVHVKIDNIGVGAGTADILERMGKDKQHESTVVRVDVRERATVQDRFANRRAEMWWNLREVVRDGTVRLSIGAKERAQIAGPTYKVDSGGRILIESKEVMKRRGLPSPDRGDGIAMAVYEPHPTGAAVSYASQLTAARLPVRVGRRAN